MASERWAGVCVGVGRHDDALFGELPQAVESAREVAKAMDSVGSIRIITNPPGHMDLFVALQKAIGEARGGSFFLYFAGFVLERDGQLLLAVSTTEAKAKSGCVPWSDVEDILKRENVAKALVVLNVEKGSVFPAAAVTKAMKYPAASLFGSIRSRDGTAAEGALRAYTDVMVKALKSPLPELEPFLTEGRLDGVGLEKMLAERAPKNLAHQTLRTSPFSVVVRDVARELERTPMSLRSPPVMKSEPKVEPSPEPPKEEAKIEAAPAPAPEPAPVQASVAPAPEPAPAEASAPAPAPAQTEAAAPVAPDDPKPEVKAEEPEPAPAEAEPDAPKPKPAPKIAAAPPPPDPEPPTLSFGVRNVLYFVVVALVIIAAIYMFKR